LVGVQLEANAKSLQNTFGEFGNHDSGKSNQHKMERFHLLVLAGKGYTVTSWLVSVKSMNPYRW